MKKRFVRFLNNVLKYIGFVVILYFFTMYSIFAVIFTVKYNELNSNNKINDFIKFSLLAPFIFPGDYIRSNIVNNEFKAKIKLKIKENKCK